MGEVIVGSIAVLIVFFAFNRSNRNRRINNRRRFSDKQEELLSILREKLDAPPANAPSNPTGTT